MLLAEGLLQPRRAGRDAGASCAAGAASFRRRPTLRKLAEAEAQVQALRTELDEDPAASNRRQQKARERAARERVQRIKGALDRLPELEAKKKPEDREKARCSTTDPDATVMKMPDGGFRPAYNVQFSTATESQIIMGVDVVTTGSDAGQMAPMVEQIKSRYDETPKDQFRFANGGFAQHDQIEAVRAPRKWVARCTCAGAGKSWRSEGGSVRLRRETVRRWPTGEPAWPAKRAKVIYKDRRCDGRVEVNAQARNRGLYQLRVRGQLKAKAIALWHALAHNMMRAVSLRAAARVRAAAAVMG